MMKKKEHMVRPSECLVSYIHHALLYIVLSEYMRAEAMSYTATCGSQSQQYQQAILGDHVDITQ